MRHRKVLNLYDTDQGHEDLLVYLEGIEGSTRQQQALLQMVMVGFRVIAFHESGDEAYYGVRNPDARPVRKLNGPRSIQRSQPERKVIESTAEKVIQPSQPKSSTKNEPGGKTMHFPEKAVDVPMPHELESTSQDDEFNTLKILKMMGEGDD